MWWREPAKSLHSTNTYKIGESTWTNNKSPLAGNEVSISEIVSVVSFPTVTDLVVVLLIYLIQLAPKPIVTLIVPLISESSLASVIIVNSFYPYTISPLSLYGSTSLDK